MPLRRLERPSWGTLRVRLALWNTAVVLTVTVAALVAARYAARTTLCEAADAELRAGAQEVTLALRDLFPDMEAVANEMRRKAASHEQRGWFIQLVREDGTQIWKSAYCPEEVATFPPHNLERPENVVRVGPYRYVRLRIVQAGRPDFHVRVGTYTTGLDEGLAGLTWVLLAVGLAICALTPLAGWWLAVRSTRPVANILETADRLDANRLTDRLPVRGSGDELDHLARTINGLLDDVAAHVDRQEQFVADAAHELRGPLAAVHSALEVAATQDRSAAEYRDTLGDVLDGVRHLSRLANDLLLLAEGGQGQRPDDAPACDIAQLTRQVAGMFAGVAEERGISLVIDAPGPTPVACDAVGLRRVLGNLLDNAIRFTPADGRIAVRVNAAALPGFAVLSVSDSGVGIEARHLSRIFDRFYKVDPARSHQADRRGGGLGLAICRSLVERWGGSIGITSTPGAGTTVTVRLPMADRLAAGGTAALAATPQPAS